MTTFDIPGVMAEVQSLAMTPVVRPCVSTSRSTSDSNPSPNVAGWQNIIDKKLIEWGWNPFEIEDDGIEPPTKESIQLAIGIAQSFQKDDRPIPSIVAPDAEGGVMFEFHNDPRVVTINVKPGRLVEISEYVNCELIEEEEIKIS